jgi:hypothetical protein
MSQVLGLISALGGIMWERGRGKGKRKGRKILSFGDKLGTQILALLLTTCET